jgi:hypothetical protein
VTQLTFNRRGHRRRPDGGLKYRSTDGRYELHKSDQVGGVRLRPVYWLAIALRDQRIISRHSKRQRAEAACRLHAKRREHNQ